MMYGRTLWLLRAGLRLAGAVFPAPPPRAGGRGTPPQPASGPPTDGPVMLGGPSLSRQGARAVPSLTYLERQPSFSIGPDDPEAETVDLAQMAVLGQQSTRARKTATQTSQSATNIVPQGGLFWDGRADTLQAQA